MPLHRIRRASAARDKCTLAIGPVANFDVMEKPEPNQLIVRSRPARKLAGRYARVSGRAITQVVEDALPAHKPPATAVPANGLVQENGVLVLAAKGKKITFAQAEAELEEIRGGDRG